MVFVTSLVLALPEDTNNLLKLRRSQLSLTRLLGLMSLVVMQKLGKVLYFCWLNLSKCKPNNEEVVSMIAKGSLEKPAKYIQSQENQARFVEATATLITYDVDEGMIFLVGNAHLVQGFDSFSGDTLNYDINNDKVIVKGSEDGTERVKFKIVL